MFNLRYRVNRHCQGPSFYRRVDDMPIPDAIYKATVALSRERIAVGRLDAPTHADITAAVATGSHGTASSSVAPKHLDSVAASIFRQQYELAAREGLSFHRASAQRARYAREYKTGSSIVEIASRARCPPYLMARLLLEELCDVRGDDVRLLLRNPDLVPDARLRSDVVNAVEVDQFFGPAVDRARAAIGAAHEELLWAALRRRDLPFISEEGMRELGAPKTPDVRLDVPIGLIDATGTARVVHWIDSKATFGDPDSHAANLRQLQGYANREGPGLVIYWFDYVESLHATTQPDVAILDHLPALFALPGGVRADVAGAGPRVSRGEPVRAMSVDDIIERVGKRGGTW